MHFNLAEESFAMQASPSKARAEALESQSWSLILEWLSKLYRPSPIPTFERNSFTLHALQSLMGENVAAEKLRDLVYEAQLEELLMSTTNEDGDRNKDLSSGETNPKDDSTTTATKEDPSKLLYQVQSSLSKPSRTALDSISEAAVLAGCSTSASSSSSSSSSSAGSSQQKNTTILQDLQSNITNLPIQAFEFETELRSINYLISNLQGEIKKLRQKPTMSTKNKSQSRSRPRRNEWSTSVPAGGGGAGRGASGRSISSPPQTPTTLSTMTFPNDDEDEDDDDEDDRHHALLHAETVQHQRETKQLTIKCSEYTERITVLERQASGPSSGTTTTATTTNNNNEPTLSDVAEKQVVLDQKKKHVEYLRRKILAFHNLPPDLEASRAEVRRAQAELDRLKSKREDLFAQLGSL